MVLPGHHKVDWGCAQFLTGAVGSVPALQIDWGRAPQDLTFLIHPTTPPPFNHTKPTPPSTAIGLRKYRIPSDLRSQAECRSVSTKVGDHLGIPGAAVFVFVWVQVSMGLGVWSQVLVCADSCPDGVIPAQDVWTGGLPS